MVAARYDVKAGFDPLKHPRDGHGRFANKPGGSDPLPRRGDPLPRRGAPSSPTPGGRGERPNIGSLIRQNGTQGLTPRELVAVHRGYRDAIEGEFAGLATVIRGVNMQPGETTVDIGVYDQGRFVGTAVRVFTDRGGELHVHHEFLELSQAAQGRGFASAFNRHMEQWYRESGVKEISVHAALDTGGYAWAAAGFDWETAGDEFDAGAADVIDRLRDKLDDLDNDLVDLQDTLDALPDDYRNRATLQARLDRLQATVDAAGALLARADHNDFGSPGYPTPFEISQVGRRPGEKDSRDPDRWWLGKKVMMGSDWRGVKPLTDPPPAGKAKSGSTRGAMMADLAAWQDQWLSDHLATDPEFNGDDPGAYNDFGSKVGEILARHRAEG